MVELKAGSGVNQVSVKVHEALLRYYSAYFESALGGHFAEADKGVIDFKDEEEADIVKRFVVWQYTKEYKPLNEIPQDFDVICKLWIFGDKRQIPLLSNMTINTMPDEIVRRWTLPSGNLRFIYENTTPDSKLRAFVAWVIAATSGSKLLTEDNRTLWPGDASFDILRLVWKRKESNSAKVTKEELAKLDMCEWHQHGKDEKCTAIPNDPKEDEHSKGIMWLQVQASRYLCGRRAITSTVSLGYSFKHA